MANDGASFNGSIFRKDYPFPIAMGRASALIHPVVLRYNAAGYAAGTILAKNTTDGVWDAYASAGASGTNKADCVLFESHAPEDFSSTSTAASASGLVVARGIYGGCEVYQASMSNYAAGVLTDLSARLITDAQGVTTMKF